MPRDKDTRVAQDGLATKRGAHDDGEDEANLGACP